MRPIRDVFTEQCTKAGKHEYKESLLQIPEDTFGIEGEITDITLYPGKALGGLSVPEARITRYGLETLEGLRDRAFMLGKIQPTHQTAMFTRFSQREEPQLSQVKPDFDGKILRYDALPNLKITLPEMEPRQGQVVTVEVVPGTVVRAVRESGPINAAIRIYLKKFRDDADQIEVLLPAADFDRPVEVRHSRNQNAQTRFSDGGQILLASEPSLKWIQKHINKAHGTAEKLYEDARQILMTVIRPNITVEGWPEHLEDLLTDAVIEGMLPVIIAGTVEEMREHLLMLFGDLSVRCSVTQVDPATGMRADDNEPIATFSKKRPLRADGSSNKATFAVNTVFPRQMWGGTFKKGDKIVSGKEKQVA